MKYLLIAITLFAFACGGTKKNADDPTDTGTDTKTETDAGEKSCDGGKEDCNKTKK